MKKLIILIVCFTLLCGCTKINNDNINDIINSVVSSDNDRANQYRNGYKFYLPNNLSTIKIDDKNNVFKENDIKYYMFVDIVSYYHKIKNNYKIDKNAYISKKLDYNSKTGYLEVNEVKGKYYIEMMFNYAKVEAYVSKYDLVDSISSMAYVLSSIKYNKNTIETMLGSGKYDLGENETYNIFETKKTTDGNFLDWVNEYDTYNGDNSSLEGLIEQDEITSTNE